MLRCGCLSPRRVVWCDRQRSTVAHRRVLRCSVCGTDFPSTALLASAVHAAFRDRGIDTMQSGVTASVEGESDEQHARIQDERIRAIKWTLQVDRRVGADRFPSDLNAARLA